MTDSIHVEHADTVDHADTVSNLVVNPTPVVLTRAEPSPDRRRSRVVMWAAIMSGCIVMILCLTSLVYVLTLKVHADQSSSRQITDLRTQLDVERAATETKLNAQRAQDDCLAVYSRNITEANADEISAIANLLVSFVTEVPGAQRDADVKSGLTKLRATDQAYHGAIDARQAFLDGGEVLPCPTQGSK